MNTKELSKTEQQIVNDAIDFVMKEYEENNKVIFKSEADRAKNQFGLTSKNIRAWKKSKECIVPMCTQKSIIKSHTIPRGMLLDSVAENGHVLTPDFSQVEGTPIMNSLGINIASTFPGFCKTHENLFEEFENNKKLESERHIYLQTYRAVCRESFRSSLLAKQNESMITNYCELRDKRLKDLIKEEAIKRGLPNTVTFSSISISEDPIIENSNEYFTAVKTFTLHIKDKILPAIEDAVFNCREDNVFIYALNIDLEFPVALSGCAPYYIDDYGQQSKYI